MIAPVEVRTQMDQLPSEKDEFRPVHSVLRDYRDLRVVTDAELKSAIAKRLGLTEPQARTRFEHLDEFETSPSMCTMHHLIQYCLDPMHQGLPRHEEEDHATLALELQYRFLSTVVHNEIAFDLHKGHEQLRWLLQPDHFEPGDLEFAINEWYQTCLNGDYVLYRHSLTLFEQLERSLIHKYIRQHASPKLCSLCISYGDYLDCHRIGEQLATAKSALEQIEGIAIMATAQGYIQFTNEPTLALSLFKEAFSKLRELNKLPSGEVVPENRKLILAIDIYRSLVRVMTHTAVIASYRNNTDSMAMGLPMPDYVGRYHALVREAERRGITIPGLDYDTLARGYAALNDDTKQAQELANMSAKRFTAATEMAQPPRKDWSLIERYWHLGTRAVISAKEGALTLNPDKLKEASNYLDDIVDRIGPEKMRHSRFFYLGLKWSLVRIQTQLGGAL